MGLSVQEQADNMLRHMNQALSSNHESVQALVNGKPGDKVASDKRLLALLRGTESISQAFQQSAMVGVGVLAIASTTIPGDLRVTTEETLGGVERRFTFYRGDFRIGTLILLETGKESGKVGGGVQILIDEATITWPAEPKFSSN